MANRLMLHNGGTRVTPDELASLSTPAPTRTHYPIAHSDMLEAVAKNIEHNGLQIVDEQHGISHDGDRYFGLLGVEGYSCGCGGDDYGLVIGLRNSHDKRFQAGLCVGSRVFICDNLAFSNEITLARKHTRHIKRDLPRLVFQAMGKLGEARRHQDRRFTTYKAQFISSATAHDTLIRSVDAKVIPASRIPDVLSEYREPRHAEFKPRNVWSLYNAFTQVGKRYPVADLVQRTIRLHGLLDTVIGGRG